MANQAKRPSTSATKALQKEIDLTPQEYHETLLKIVKAFREGVSMTTEEERFARSWKQAVEGDVIPLNALWDSDDKS